MQIIDEGCISIATGLEGDSKGAKFPRRQITILSAEAWQEALAAVGQPDLPWTARRANLLVRGIVLPRARGAVLAIGGVRLEVTEQTYPCRRMEEACAGLLKALAPDWRGGVTCRVTAGGVVRLGDAIAVLVSPPEQLPLPLP